MPEVFCAQCLEWRPLAPARPAPGPVAAAQGWPGVCGYGAYALVGNAPIFPRLQATLEELAQHFKVPAPATLALEDLGHITGLCDTQSGRIALDKRLLEEPLNALATLCHEFAHWLLAKRGYRYRGNQPWATPHGRKFLAAEKGVYAWALDKQQAFWSLEGAGAK